MWYELWPFAGVMMTMIMLPEFANIGINKLFNKGHVHSRKTNECDADFIGYWRDKKITGSMYIPKGLETIPDEK